MPRAATRSSPRSPSDGDFRPIGASLDDAAGEAFDKGARLLGLGYPGGAELERLAASGDPAAYPFPTAMLGHPGHDFSFSGLKTALRHAVAEHPAEADRPHLAASYQAAIVRSLVGRTAQALDATGHTRAALVGGVAANTVLRQALNDAGAKRGVEVRAAPMRLCSDNAAMIASAARYTSPLPYPDYLARDAFASA